MLVEGGSLWKKSSKGQIHGQEAGVAGIIVSPARAKKGEIAGRKVYAMTCGVMNVG